MEQRHGFWPNFAIYVGILSSARPPPPPWSATNGAILSSLTCNKAKSYMASWESLTHFTVHIFGPIVVFSFLFDFCDKKTRGKKVPKFSNKKNIRPKNIIII